MNIVIILAGGTGTRMGVDRPKQYIEVKGKPIISFCIEKFENCNIIDGIIIVAAKEWQQYIRKNLINISKFIGFASAGDSRQESILNGMKNCPKKAKNIIIHDAARPNVSEKLILNCVKYLDEYDGVMPVLTVKDTIYYSSTGEKIDKLINRDCLFAGQAPEAFNYNKYMKIHDGLSKSQLASVRGSSQIAFENGLNIKLINGEEHNYKITTIEDLRKFEEEMK